MKIWINGRELEARKGQTVLEVANANGIYIPSLCYHAKTGPAGKCRSCLVELEGRHGTLTACTLEASENMKITTDSHEIREAQRVIVDFMLSSGKHDCLICERNGECELQEVAYYLGIERPTFRIDTDEFETDDSSEFIIRDQAKCIDCGRCIVGCNETVVNEVLGFANRGSETQVVCDDNQPMGESTCVQCGECAQLCPVGAIVDRNARGKGRPWELKKIETICGYCGVGCKMTMHVDEKRNKIVKVTGAEGAATNDGMLCVKGRYGNDFVSSDERLTTPLIKDGDGNFQEATWDEAIALVADKFKTIKTENGPDALGGFASAKVTNEENYAFQKFMRKEVGTNNVDHCARL